MNDHDAARPPQAPEPPFTFGQRVRLVQRTTPEDHLPRYVVGLEWRVNYFGEHYWHVRVADYSERHGLQRYEYWMGAHELQPMPAEEDTDAAV